MAMLAHPARSDRRHHGGGFHAARRLCPCSVCTGPAGNRGSPNSILSGTKFHADGALVEHGDKKYIAVALMEDEHGGEVFPKLIRKMDALVTAP